MITSTVSVNSGVSASTTSLKKSALKKPKKDVSVSFKQMPDTEEEDELATMKMNNDDSQEEDRNEDYPNGNIVNDEDNKPDHNGETYEENNTKL